MPALNKREPAAFGRKQRALGSVGTGRDYFLGINTASITWITPFEQTMSVFTTCA